MQEQFENFLDEKKIRKYNYIIIGGKTRTFFFIIFIRGNRKKDDRGTARNLLFLFLEKQIEQEKTANQQLIQYILFLKEQIEVKMTA